MKNQVTLENDPENEEQRKIRKKLCSLFDDVKWRHSTRTRFSSHRKKEKKGWKGLMWISTRNNGTYLSWIKRGLREMKLRERTRALSFSCSAFSTSSHIASIGSSVRCVHLFQSQFFIFFLLIAYPSFTFFSSIMKM